MEKLKKRWNLKTNWDLIAVFLVFAINGSFAAKIGGPIMEFLNMTKDNTNIVLWIILRILIVFPIYQLTLPIVGWLFGQFKFFWAFEKKFLSRLGFGFLFKNK